MKWQLIQLAKDRRQQLETRCSHRTDFVISSSLTLPLALAIGAILAATWIIPSIQAHLLVSKGSDHPVHIFVINCIRESGYRLFSRVPRLINESYCGAMPLFLHWLLARMPLTVLAKLDVTLNPTFNFLINLLGLCSLAALSDLDFPSVAAILLLLGATPLYYHAFSARNFGVSSRSIGIFLFCAFFVLQYLFDAEPGLPLLVALLITGYLIFGFNTFALQALLLFAPLLALFGVFTPMLFVASSGAIFVSLHPRYGASYLLHTFLFVKTYREQLASVFILKRRHSVWRDFVFDFWSKLKTEPFSRTFYYAYTNPAVNVVLLNPVTVAGAAAYFLSPHEGFLMFSARMALCGIILSLTTSLRATRFLGEPERYVEIIALFGAASGGTLLLDRLGMAMTIAIGTALTVITCLQIYLAYHLNRHLTASGHSEMEDAFDAISRSMSGAVRFSSNTDQVIKFALTRPWQFARHWSFEMPFAGMKVTEAFDAYPAMYPASFARVVRTYDINALVLDRTCWSEVEDAHKDAFNGFKSCFDGQRYQALIRSASP